MKQRIVLIAAGIAALTLAEVGYSANTANTANAGEPLAHSFEIRTISADPKANGITDFKGPTEVLNTEARIGFLRDWAKYGSSFFGDPNIDTLLVKPGEAAALLKRIKPQPLPDVRRVIPLESWHWLSSQPGQRDHTAWAKADGAQVTGGCLKLETSQGEVRVGGAFPIVEKPWRMQATLRVRMSDHSNGSLVVRLLGDIGKEDKGGAVLCTMSLDPAKHPSLADGQWHTVQVDMNFTLGRFNSKLDGKWLEYDRPMAKNHPANCSGIDLIANTSCEVDEIRVANILSRPKDGENPLDPRIVLFEDFQGDFDPLSWAQPGLDISTWDTAQLPFAIGGVEYAGKDLLFRTEITLPKSPVRAILRLETLTPSGEVWVNGRPVAVIDNRTPQALDITRYLKVGANLIALRVNNYSNPDRMHHSPLDPNIGWFAGRARLELTNDVRITHGFTRTISLDGDTANTRHKLSLINQSSRHFSGMVRISLAPWFPNEAEPVAQITRDVHMRPHRGTELDIDLPIPKAHLWMPGQPNLYMVRVTLLDQEKKPIDDWVTTTGLRMVDQKGGFFRLNGRPTGLHGVQIMGYRMPLLDMVRQVRCAPAEVLATELIQTQRCGSNYLRVHVHASKGAADGINDSRLAEMADQLGIMLSWQTPAWIRESHASGIDLANWPAYAKEAINHPSIVTWELGNHPNKFREKGTPKSESEDFINEVMSTVLSVDDTRLIVPTTHWVHTSYASKESSPPPSTPDLYNHPLNTRGTQDAPTGYGFTWKNLRLWPGGYAKTWLEDPDFAYFNWEHQESAAQPNWSLAKNTPWEKVFSYEHGYDKGSIGRNLTPDQWRESQAWQAFSAWESMKKMRQHGVSGFSWCCLHGGANTGSYKKPIIDNLGYAKLAYWANKMAFQPTVAGSWDVDTSYGPQDVITPAIIHLGDAMTVDLKVTIRNLSGKVLKEKSFPGIHLPSGRKTLKLAPISLDGLKPGTVAVEYELRQP